MPDLATLGVGLVILGVVLLLLEASMPGFFIAVPATVLIILGIFAFYAPSYALWSRWAPILVLVVGLPTTLGTIWLYQRIAPADQPPVTLSADNIRGREGRVTTEVTSHSSRGKVRVAGQMWSATTTSDEPIPEGSSVRVERVEGVILVVALAEENPGTPATAATHHEDPEPLEEP